MDDPTPFLRGIVAELGYKRKEIPYEQPKRGRKTTTIHTVCMMRLCSA
mgnify:CR=1 FL=1